jgi:hypothetical protein
MFFLGSARVIRIDFQSLQTSYVYSFMPLNQYVVTAKGTFPATKGYAEYVDVILPKG